MQADTVEHFLVVIGEADVFQLDEVVRRQLFCAFRALHILAGQHLCHLADDGVDLRNVVGVGEGGDQRLHNAEGEDDDRQKCFRRQCAVHIEKAAHRQNAEKRGGKYRHARRLSEEAAAHPVDEAVRAFLCGGNKFCVAGLGLAEGLDDLNAADVFHSRVVQHLCRGDRALELLVIAAEHGRKAENTQRNDDQHGKTHAPVLGKEQHQHRQRAHNVGGHLRQQVGKGGFDGIDPLDDDVLIRAGGTIQHRTQRQRRQLIQQPCAGIGQHMEGGVMGEGRGHAVQHIAQHPAARHPRAERQTLRQFRRASDQCGDEPDDDEIRRKGAGDTQQRRKYTQSVFAVPTFCQLQQP